MCITLRLQVLQSKGTCSLNYQQKNPQTVLRTWVIPCQEGILRRHYSPMVDTIQKKFGGWRLHTLSYGGRCVLTKHVLESLPIYYMGARMLPKSTLKELEILNRKFFWGKVSAHMLQASWCIADIPYPEQQKLECYFIEDY
jgi:hypothetical protein